MPGPLDPTNSLGFLDPSGTDIFSSPEFRRQRLFDMLGGIGMGLMKAGAPSPYPKNVGSTIAEGLAGGAAAGQGSEDRYLRRAMTASQVAKNRSQMAADKALNDLFAGGGGPAPQAAAPPAAQPAPAGAPASPAPNREAFVQMMMPHALEVSKATGLDPRLVIAQAALETGYGSAAPGNNYFGIKSHGQPGGQTLATTEAGPNGMVPTNDSFRTYADPSASARDYAEFLKSNSRYQPVLGAQGLDAQIDAMGKSGYATDPNYAGKLRQIAQGLPQQGGPMVAQGGDAGPLTHDGKPARQNADGSHSTEISITVTNPRLNGGRPTNIPSLWGGQQLDEEGAVTAALQSGRSFQAFPTIDAAVTAAKSRSNAGGAAAAVADGSGTPVQPQQAQYQPPTMRTMQEVVSSIPPGVRQLAGAMPREQKLQLLMKYADPGSAPALDTTTGQVVFVPNTAIGRDPRFQPVEGERLNMDRERLGMDKDKARRDAANAKITVGPGGQPVPNPTVLDYEKRLKTMEDEFKQAEEKRKQEAGQSEKTFGQEKQVRGEYESQPAVKSYRIVVPMLESAKDAVTRPTRAADLNLVYAFAKLMDPDSVVRESETAGVVATASVADRVAGYVNQLNGQAMLSPETRAKLMDELQSRFVSLKESNDVLASQYTDIARAYGLDPSRVVIPIRAPGRGPGGRSDNQPTQDELKGWAANPPGAGGGVRLKYVPGKGTVPQ